MIRFQTDDCFTPEEEAAQDAREAEREVDEWLQSWADDFYSDAWAKEADHINRTATTAPVVMGAVRLSGVVAA